MSPHAGGARPGQADGGDESQGTPEAPPPAALPHVSTALLTPAEDPLSQATVPSSGLRRDPPPHGHALQRASGLAPSRVPLFSSSLPSKLGLSRPALRDRTGLGTVTGSSPRCPDISPPAPLPDHTPESHPAPHPLPLHPGRSRSRSDPAAPAGCPHDGPLPLRSLFLHPVTSPGFPPGTEATTPSGRSARSQGTRILAVNKQTGEQGSQGALRKTRVSTVTQTPPRRDPSWGAPRAGQPKAAQGSPGGSRGP